MSQEIEIKLPYVRDANPVIFSQTRISELYSCNTNISEVYQRYRVRDKLIYLFDARYQFLEYLFEPQHINGFGRKLISMLTMINKQEISDTLKELMSDVKFRRVIEKVYYCEFIVYNVDDNFYEFIIAHLQEHYKKTMDDMRRSIKGVYSYVLNGYTGFKVYIAINKNDPTLVMYDSKYYMEALGDAKNWNCVIPYGK